MSLVAWPSSVGARLQHLLQNGHEPNRRSMPPFFFFFFSEQKCLDGIFEPNPSHIRVMSSTIRLELIVNVYADFISLNKHVIVAGNIYLKLFFARDYGY